MMTSNTKKILGVLGVGLAIYGIALYTQYKRLMNYKLTFKGIKVKKATPQNINFDLFLNFQNFSTLKFTIISQEYSIYINDKFVSKVQNQSSNFVEAKATSVIGVNVDIDIPKVTKILEKNWAEIVLRPDTVKVRVDTNLKVRILGIKFNIPMVYDTNLKDLIKG